MQYLLAPVNTIADLTVNPQLAARDFWVDLDHPELNVRLTYPGAPFKSNRVSWRIDRRAPLVGEHNSAIYGDELGFADTEIRSLARKGAI
jgi:crotonobetainyl-CoA:carnitine CoA-transferase CaiB-like acyl-CoA transferase